MNKEELIKEIINGLEPDSAKNERVRTTYSLKRENAEFLDLYQKRKGYKSKSQAINSLIEDYFNILAKENYKKILDIQEDVKELEDLLLKGD